MGRRAVIALGILLACCACASALDPSLDISQYAHTAWKIRDGFAKGIIYSIAQTPDGYVWLATEVGLLRLDGIRAVPWQPPAGQHLPDSQVWRLHAARDGTLWIGTTSGLASWKDGKLLQHPELGDRAVDALFEDRGGTIWVGTSNLPNGRLCAIQGGKGQCYGEAGTLGPVNCVYEDKAGNLWAGAERGLLRLKPGTPKLYVMPDSASVEALIAGDNGELLIATGNGIRRLVGDKVEAYSLPGIGGQFKPNSMLRDRNGGLWIGTEDRGLLHVHHGRADVFTQADDLSGNYVTNLFEDREHNIWVSTLTGLDRFRDFTVSTISVKQGLSNDTVLSVLAARDGSVWFGTRDGLNRWKDGQITIYRKPSARARTDGAMQEEHLNVREITGSGLPDSSVGSLGEDAQGRIWVSTNAGVGYFENDRFIPIPDAPAGKVAGIAADGAGNLWISNRSHGLVHVVGNRVVEQIPWDKLGHKDFALTLLADPLHGGLWLGLFHSGLVYWKNGQIVSSYTAKAMGSGSISDLQSDPDGTLWASTEGGLSRVNNGGVATLSSKNGLPCDNVHGMMEDNAHSVWLYMGCGLVRIARKELDAWAADPKRTIQVTVFDGTEGVRSHEIETPYSPRIAKSADGKIWFLPFDGVSFLDPQHISFNKLPPPVHIEQITAGRKTYDASNGLRLPPHIRDLEIDYTALSFVAPERVRFRYKLEGLDSDWQEAGNRRQAFYTNLPPRHYRFRVIASNNSGVWNEQDALLDFAITPAYYQTNWFRALCATAFLALLWAGYEIRVRQLRQQERKLRDVIETIPTFAWTALSDGSVDFVNHHWEEYTGFSAEKSVGSGWAAAVHPSDLKRNARKWRASVETGEPFENELRFRRADGEYRWFLVRAVPLRGAQGKILKWYGTSTDIEDRKRAEQEREILRADLAHVNRVTTMGELTASLAHEIKQPIAATVMNANACLRWLMRDQPDLDEVREAANRILRDGNRAGDIIERLRLFYKKSPPKRELVSVNEIVHEMVGLLRGEANRYAVSIRTDLAADLPQITADRVQLQQVLMNLMLNAIEAMKETGGVLTVKSQLDQDGRVTISVSDTGVGLPAETADQIFNAFFTTKPQGSGMGLAISRSIVESHGGRLWATPNAGRGATFHFTLPTAAEVVKVPATGT